MMARIIFATVVTSSAASFALGITYSRPRQSPTPTPTPVQVQSPIASQRPTVAPRTTPTPIPPRYAPVQRQIQARQAAPPQQQQGMMPSPTPMTPGKYAPTQPQVQARQSPTPQQRTAQIQNQLPLQAQRTTTLVPKPTAAPMQPRVMPAPAPIPVKPTPTPVPPPDVKAYLDRQVANSKDQKFHMNVNGKDLALTPFHVWPQRITGFNATSTSISMRSDEGRVYDIEFVTTGPQVTSIRIQRVNGE